MGNNNGIDNENGNNNLARIGEEGDVLEETNPLAIVPDNNPLPSPRRTTTGGGAVVGSGGNHSEVSVHRVKREEVETKISAWQTAKVAKINNRFKREDAIIGGWESAQVQKATSWMKKVEVREKILTPCKLIKSKKLDINFFLVNRLIYIYHKLARS